MGEHKYNRTAIMARNGEIAPKPKKMGKREADRYLTRLIRERLLYHLMRGMEKYQEEQDGKM